MVSVFGYRAADPREVKAMAPQTMTVGEGMAGTYIRDRRVIEYGALKDDVEHPALSRLALHACHDTVLSVR
jgi:hypothetical protein